MLGSKKAKLCTRTLSTEVFPPLTMFINDSLQHAFMSADAALLLSCSSSRESSGDHCTIQNNHSEYGFTELNEKLNNNSNNSTRVN